VREEGAARVRMVCLVAAPEGLAAFGDAHPDVPVWCAAVDRELDSRGFIRPGLGDAGDRLYGTD
jgi:uracil phosphoribosyltransferase